MNLTGAKSEFIRKARFLTSSLKGNEDRITNTINTKLSEMVKETNIVKRGAISREIEELYKERDVNSITYFLKVTRLAIMEDDEVAMNYFKSEIPKYIDLYSGAPFNLKFQLNLLLQVMSTKK